MQNNFKKGVEEARKNIQIVEATKVATSIKQYGGLDVYDLMKKGDMYAIVVDGIVIGGASSKEDADKAIEFLTHFTGGQPLNKDTLMTAGAGAMKAMTRANNLVEAEAEGTVKIQKTYTIDDKEYIVDETSELYSIDGDHICNIADLLAALKSKNLTEELYLELLKGRIDKYWAEEEAKRQAEAAAWEDEGCEGDCETCEYADECPDYED